MMPGRLTARFVKFFSLFLFLRFETEPTARPETFRKYEIHTSLTFFDRNLA